MSDVCPECGGDNIEEFEDGALCVDCGFEGDESAAGDDCEHLDITSEDDGTATCNDCFAVLSSQEVAAFHDDHCDHWDVNFGECLDCGQMVEGDW